MFLKEIFVPNDVKNFSSLKIGDVVYISGEIICMRDLAHNRLLSGVEIPFSLTNATIYHCGPLAIKENNNWKIISAGPTTSTRMENYVPILLKKFGVKGFIGKGGFHKNLNEFKKYKAIYFLMTGGCGSLAASAIKKIKNIFWLDLGIPEAVWILEVKKLGPVVVVIDSEGNSLFR